MSIKGKLRLVRGGAKPSRFKKNDKPEIQYPITRYNHLTPKKVKTPPREGSAAEGVFIPREGSPRDGSPKEGDTVYIDDNNENSSYIKK